MRPASQFHYLGRPISVFGNSALDERLLEVVQHMLRDPQGDLIRFCCCYPLQSFPPCLAGAYTYITADKASQRFYLVTLPSLRP